MCTHAFVGSVSSIWQPINWWCVGLVCFIVKNTGLDTGDKMYVHVLMKEKSSFNLDTKDFGCEMLKLPSESYLVKAILASKLQHAYFY